MPFPKEWLVSIVHAVHLNIKLQVCILLVYDFEKVYTFWGCEMRRTNIEIDEVKLEKIKDLTGASTIKEAVDKAFEELIRIDKQRKVLAHRGMGGWEGDLDEMRGR